MNEKKWIKIRIIAWSIVAALLVVVFVAGIRGWGVSIFTKEYTISTKKVVKELKFEDIDDFKNIKISLNTSDLIISENDEDNIQMIVKSSRKLKNNKYIESSINSGTLTLEDTNKKSSKNLFGILNKCALEVEIKIPKSYNKNLTIDNRIGDITFNSDLNLNNLNINLKTGDIDIDKVINANKINIISNIGDINFDEIKCKYITIKGKTGDVDIDKLSGYGKIESQVGDITCGIEKLNGDIDFESHVGDINLSVDRDLKFILEGNKNIGDMHTDLEFSNISQSSKTFLGQYGENPKNKITVNVKTGDISIDK